MTTSPVPLIELNDGHSIPQLGFGVFKVDPHETQRVVSDALEAGYRHLDTAMIYDNEEAVGRAIAASGIARDELFVTTKLWNDDQGFGSTHDAFDASLERLGLDYVDLYLIHWPCPAKDQYVDTWRALEEIRESERARSIGVSNFLVPQLDRLLSETDVVPAVDQIELHPHHQQPKVSAFGRERGIQIEAWGPLGQGKNDLLDLHQVQVAAEAHDKTPAQVVIRWHLQSGNILFPKSTHKQRMTQNLDVFDFDLTGPEMRTLNALESAGRLGGDPSSIS